MKSKVNQTKVVVMGGGTGTYSTLLGLKKYPLDISVIVTMMDSGGSNRVIRDEFGLLPTSDIRQAIVALSSNEVDETLRQLFTYRYSQGTGLNGMTFGNLFMLALTDILGNQKEAIEQTCRIFNTLGKIYPVTYDNSQLLAKYENGKEQLGEHNIDEPVGEYATSKIIGLETIPKANANQDAIDAIINADYIIYAPGDLFTSLFSNFVVNGIVKALNKSKAKKIYILNLMTKHGQTNHFKASDYCFELSKYLNGRNPDYILINNKKPKNKDILNRYKLERAEIVIDDLDQHIENLIGTKIIRDDFLSTQIHNNAKGDKLKRSFVRHDSDKLAKSIYKLINLNS